jgi:hypothetical protein
LQPQEYFSTAHICWMLLKNRTIVTEFVRTAGWVLLSRAAVNSSAQFARLRMLRREDGLSRGPDAEASFGWGTRRQAAALPDGTGLATLAGEMIGIGAERFSSVMRLRFRLGGFAILIVWRKLLYLMRSVRICA